MKKIKEFFDKKQNDLKFKSAGAGHKLSESSSNRASSASVSTSTGQGPSSRRTGPDSNVASAALSRFENKTNPGKPAPKSTLHDIMAEEKKKIAQDMQLQDEAEKLKKQQPSPQEQTNPFKEYEDSQKFSCPSLDINSSLPFVELMCKMKAQIFDNFADDPILRSAMCLFNCNRTISQDQTQLQSGLDILKKIVTNLQTENIEELQKFKRIRRSKIEQKVLSLDGALDLLFAIGFSIDSDQDWLVLAEHDEDMTKKMQYVYELLASPQIIPIELDRKLQYITDDIQTSEDVTDLKLTSSDLKQFYSNLEKNREINEMFISKDTKAKLLSKSSNFKPLFSRLKFKLSLTENEIETVQAVFYSSEMLSDIKNWLLATFSPLFDGKEICFKVGSDLFANDSLYKSLAELKLTPAATLIVIAK